MTVVYALIQAKAGKVWAACKDTENLTWIESAQVVTGPYDIIAYALLPSADNPRELLENIHGIEGVTHSELCVAI